MDPFLSQTNKVDAHTNTANKSNHTTNDQEDCGRLYDKKFAWTDHVRIMHRKEIDNIDFSPPLQRILFINGHNCVPPQSLNSSKLSSQIVYDMFKVNSASWIWD